MIHGSASEFPFSVKRMGDRLPSGFRNLCLLPCYAKLTLANELVSRRCLLTVGNGKPLMARRTRWRGGASVGPPLVGSQP